MPKSESSLNELLYDLKRIEEHREKLTEEKIRKMYKQLMKELKTFLSDTYIDFASADGRLYMAQMQEGARYARFLEKITEHVDGITPSLQSEMHKLIDETYERSYRGMAEAVTNAKNTQQIAAIMPEGSLIRPEVLQNSITNNISKLTLPDVLEKYRQSIVYDIKQTLTVGLVNGDRYEDMVKRVDKILSGDNGTGGYYKKACNIVRTETHRNIETGFMDCAKGIANGLQGSGYVYVAIWRTMKDERVRPQIRRKTKRGWKTTYSKNGANHMKMEGVTIRVGDKFKLESGVFAENPSASGVARHDCNCRCTVEYDLLSSDEWEELKTKQENGFIKPQAQ